MSTQDPRGNSRTSRNGVALSLRSKRNLKKCALVAPQLLAMLCLVLQPVGISRAIYLPDSSNNPYWFSLGSEGAEPASGPDWTDDGNGVPAWRVNFEAAVNSGAIVWWAGNNFLIDGGWQSLPAQYHAPVGDSDNDGIPDDLDRYQNDSNNNTFSWQGGFFAINNTSNYFSAGYYAGTWADSDGDGLPDSLDLYPNDANNGNTQSPFWWAGGSFTISNQSVTFDAQYYFGNSSDSDYDGIPDGADPFPSDSNNGNASTVWWSGGTFIIDGVSVSLAGQSHSGDAGDADTDGIPDDLDSYPNDATNNSFWWSGGTFTVNGTSVTFYPQYYPGTAADSDGDGIPDALDLYVADTTNNTSYWEGGMFLLNGQWSTYGAQYYAGLPIDTDSDGIPDALDPYANDPWNNTNFYWSGGTYVINGAVTILGAATFGGFWSDGDYDGIPDVADPYPSDANNNTATWNGGMFLIDGNYSTFGSLQHRADAGDADGDGMPDDLDAYPNDSTNNSFWWNGGTFTVNNGSISFTAQYYAGNGIDSDNDGIPNSLDPYPSDANNGNTSNSFWWGGGTYTINGNSTYFNADWYSGSWSDVDSDGIPDVVDPWPNDSGNNNPVYYYWGGGYYTISNTNTYLSGGYYSGSWSDVDSDGIPDPADPYPSDWNNNNTTTNWFSGGSFYIDGVLTWVGERSYIGSSADSDTDGLPDGVDPYTNDNTNNTAWWSGGTFVVDGQAVIYGTLPYPANTGDGDGDGIPDFLDPHLNDEYNNSYFRWPAQTVAYTVNNQTREFTPQVYPLPNVDSDSDGIPDAADPYPADGTNGNDTDHDGIPDAVELQYGLNPNNPYDAQNLRADGLTHKQIYDSGMPLDTPPLDVALDSDGDGMNDIYEIANSLNRLNPNDAVEAPGGDFVFNLEKAQHGIPVTTIIVPENYETVTGHPFSSINHDAQKSVAENDWDGDGVSNVDEVLLFHTDARDATAYPAPSAIRLALMEQKTSLTTRTNYLWMVDNGQGNGVDADGDGLPDWYEVLIGTDPNSANTDGDDMNDGAEIIAGRDPCLFDTPPDVDSDGDGASDVWELAHGFDPHNQADGAGDADNDGWSNRDEYRMGTDPWRSTVHITVITPAGAVFVPGATQP